MHWKGLFESKKSKHQISNVDKLFLDEANDTVNKCTENIHLH